VSRRRPHQRRSRHGQRDDGRRRPRRNCDESRSLRRLAV